MTPAFAHALLTVCDRSRALTTPSPVNACDTKWNSSERSQMSPPPPSSVQVPDDSVCAPGGVAPPTSSHCQPVGQMPGGATEPGATATESSVTAPPTPSWCDVIANPASSEPVMFSATADPGTAFHVTPFGDVYAVKYVC